METFGIVIATCRTDIHFAQASYMSIRHFMGKDIPVCFIVDGAEDLLGVLRKDPNVSWITRETTQNPWLKDYSFGWGTTKMVAFYEAPFDRFLYLDSDALPFGDVRKLDDIQYDMVTDCNKSCSDAEINFWFFDTEKIKPYWPDFKWQSYRDRFFCTGTYFSKKNIFSLENYQEKLIIAKQHPEVFNFGGEMGFLNLMIFYGVQKEELKVKSTSYQIIPVDIDNAVLKNQYSPQTLEKEQAPKVIHFCGKKPNIMTFSPKVATMNYFRFRYLMEKEGLSLLDTVFQMAYQDFCCVTLPWLKRGVRKAKRIMSTLARKK
jgi:hypothetical protein